VKPRKPSPVQLRFLAAVQDQEADEVFTLAGTCFACEMRGWVTSTVAPLDINAHPSSWALTNEGRSLLAQ